MKNLIIMSTAGLAIYFAYHFGYVMGVDGEQVRLVNASTRLMACEAILGVSHE